jgi:CO/xanthine dehydrogenase Mo-binding subunit
VLDLIADEGGLDPAEVRRVNFIPPDQFPYTTLSGEHYDTGEYDKPLTKALEVIGYQKLRQEQAEARKQGRYLGIGISTYVEICGFGPYDSATVRVEPSGDVSIFTGISPHGQGQETTFAQLAADYIGADFDRIVVHHGDTANTPQGNGRKKRAGSPRTSSKQRSRISSWSKASTASKACRRRDSPWPRSPIRRIATRCRTRSK